MLRLSKKTDYALILLGHLSTCEEPISAIELADYYHLPHPMVANILKNLASSGLISSIRGQKGGYLLAKEPKEISLNMVLKVTDVPFQLIDCVHSGENCTIHEYCPTRDSLIAVHEKLAEFMDQFTLEEIISNLKFINSVRRPQHEVPHLS